MKLPYINAATKFRTTLALTAIAVIAASGCFAQQAATNSNPTAEDVQLYLPFNGSLDALKPTEGVRSIQFKSANANAPEFVDGVEGKALRITKANGTELNLILGLNKWPVEKGSLVVWFRPQKKIEDQPILWLVQGEWAKFDMHVEGGRLLFYNTGNTQDFVIGDIKDFATNWVGKWHCAVAVWEGKKQSLYLDGKLLVEKSDVTPLTGAAPTSFALGYLPQTGKPGLGILEGDLDEVALLKTALTAAQVSALTTKGKGGVLNVLGGDILGSMERRAYVRGEKATLKLLPYAAGDSIKVTAIAEEDNKEFAIASTPVRAGDVVIDTNRFRPGRYHLRLEVLAAGKKVVSNEALVMGINARRVAEFPVGIDALGWFPDSTLATMQKWNIGLTSNLLTPDGLQKDLDRLYLYGISTQSNFNIHNHNSFIPYTPDPSHYKTSDEKVNYERMYNEVLQGIVYEDGKWFSSSGGSPFSSIGRQAMNARITDFMRASKNHRGLHSVSFDDEYELRVGTDPKTGKRYYGDYGPLAAEYFKEKTGLANVVLPPTEPEGTIFPDNHPYFKWRDIIGMPGDVTNSGTHVNNTEQTALIHRLRPDVLTTSWSGGEYGEVDAVMDYIYPAIWQPHPGYDAGHGRLDFMYDRHRARQRVEKLKPVWGLAGWWSDNLQGQPDWIVDDFRLTTAMTLAKGAKLINWFTAFAPYNAPAGQLGAGLLSRDDLAGETEHWAKWIHRYGGMFARVEAHPSRRVAVLISETNTAGMLHKWGAPIAFDTFYPAMRIAGVPVDLITDEQIMAGKLDQYEALCLFGIRYSSTSLWAKIKEYSATAGKVVICDDGTNPKLRPSGAVVLDINVVRSVPGQAGKSQMETVLATVAANVAYTRQKIAPLLRPDTLQVSGSDLVAPHWLYGNEGRFLSLVNYNLYGAESVNVALQKVGGAVYDIDTQKVVAQAAKGQPLTWKAEAIEKAGWKPYLILPQKIASPGVTAHLTTGFFNVSASVRGTNAAVIKAPIPVHIEFFDASGKPVTAYETYTAIDATTGLASLKVARATMMDRAGIWTVKVTELISGTTASAKIKVA